MSLKIDPDLLDRVATRLGMTNKSELVNRLLARADEDDDTIIAGLDAAFGAYPDFPLDAAP